MDAEQYLVLFDVDGTLVDSQLQIMDAMKDAFMAIDHPVPTRQDILSIVGLSLPDAFSQLLTNKPQYIQERCVEIYKLAFAEARAKGAKPQFYPGVYEVLAELYRHPNYILGIATGKSRRGLNALLDSYEIAPWFVTAQVADDHPSKPNPSMIKTAMREANVDRNCAVMIGDTSFDIDMAKSAGVFAIGVGWGYHPHTKLAAADMLVHQATDLLGAIENLLRE